MKTTLKKGDLIHGFEVLDVRDLDELEATGIYLRHGRSGAELFHILNDDDENLFAFAFATPPTDSTGVAHILEHSVLSGSRNHPLKDAFLVLAQGSLQTFLNALTFPDKTLYPASSTNETDYFNLMEVYADAVFRPLLSRYTFLQEGHRLEFGPDGTPSRVGIVYNEMKGNYSSMDSIAGDAAFRSVLEGTPYQYDSGGDPLEIPKLRWEDLVSFHERYYAPSNCRIFLAGNVATEKQLAFLDERFLSSFERHEPAPPAPMAPRWSAPRQIVVPYPAAAGAASTVMVSWLCSDATDPDEALALAALSDLLLGHDGAPLARALVESGLGEDLAPASGAELELRESVFVAGLRGVASADGPKVESLILSVLSRLAKEGIPAQDLDATLRGMEFSNREIRRAGGPFSLVWMRRSLRGWLHGKAPWETLLFEPPFAALKERLAREPRYMESLIERYFLDNPHRALVSVVPAESLAASWAAEESRSAAAEAEALGDAGRAEARRAAEELARIQAAPDAPESLATIPHLSRSDLEAKVDVVPRSLDAVGGVPVVSHELFTNGVSYLDWAFPVDLLDPDDYPYLPLLARSITSTGLPGMDYGEVSLQLSRLAGGFSAYLQSGAAAPGAKGKGAFDLLGREWLVFRLRALDDSLEEAVPLAARLVYEADLGDLRRMGDLVAEMKNDYASALAPSGHSFATGRAGRRWCRSRTVDEIWSGITQLRFAQDLSRRKLAEVVARLESIRTRIISSGVIVHRAGGSGALARCGGLTERLFARYGAPASRPSASPDGSAFFSLLDGGVAGSEAFSSPSLQVGFGALAIAGDPYGSREQAADLALAHHLSTGPLMESIRMKGGAYGAFAYGDVTEELFLMATYRDPAPTRSLGACVEALRNAAGRPLDGDDLEKTIVGAYSKETRPRAPSDRAFADFLRTLYGIDDETRRSRLSYLLDLTGREIAAAAGRLAAASEDAVRAVLSGEAEARVAAAALGVDAQSLPV